MKEGALQGSDFFIKLLEHFQKFTKTNTRWLIAVNSIIFEKVCTLPKKI